MAREIDGPFPGEDGSFRHQQTDGSMVSQKKELKNGL